MVKFDLTKTEDLASVGMLLSNGIYPTSGTNYIKADNSREFYAYFPDSCKAYLKNRENTKEYKAAYLMAVFIDEANKQVPLVQHVLPNKKEILIPADMPKDELKKLILNL